MGAARTGRAARRCCRGRAGAGGCGERPPEGDAGARAVPPAERSGAPGRRTPARSPSCAAFAAASTPASSCPDALARGAGELPHDARASLAALLRRLEGEYAEDDWGFDEEFADLAEPFFEFLYDRWWRVQAVGAAARAGARARAAGRQPRRHPALGRDDDRRRAAARAPAAAPPALPRARLGLRPAVRLGRDAQARRRDGLARQRARACSSRTTSWRSSPRASRAPARTGASATACSASAAAASSRSRCAPARRSCRWRSSAARRSTPSSASCAPLAKLLGAPYFPVTPTFPWLGPLGMVPLPSKWRIEFCEPIDTARYGPDAADDRALVLELSAARARHDPADASTTTSSPAAARSCRRRGVRR